jgi:hypothetical protein
MYVKLENATCFKRAQMAWELPNFKKRCKQIASMNKDAPPIYFPAAPAGRGDMIKTKEIL